MRTSNERHMSADTFLDLSCRVENIAQDYCVRTGCPPEEGIEALLSAAAHYAVWSHQTKVFTRIADKLSSRIASMIRENPEFLRLNGTGGSAHCREAPAEAQEGIACESSAGAAKTRFDSAADVKATVSALEARRRALIARQRELRVDLQGVEAAVKQSIAQFRTQWRRRMQQPL